MISGLGDGPPAFRPHEHCREGADRESFEIRYVDPAEATLWASERGFCFGQDDFSSPVIAYLD